MNKIYSRTNLVLEYTSQDQQVDRRVDLVTLNFDILYISLHVA